MKEGLPPIQGRDTGHFHCGKYAAAQADVRRNLAEHGVDWSRTTLIPGFYDETLAVAPTEYDIRRCVICVIDCDLYESSRLVLSFVEPILDTTSYLVFDDWNCFNADPEKGERRAFAEFMERTDGRFVATQGPSTGRGAKYFGLIERSSRIYECWHAN